MRKLPLVLLFTLLAPCLHGLADTVTLKDGTKIEGTITQQDDTQVTISYKISDSISDERILRVEDISKIEKTSEDSIAFEQLGIQKPGEWQMLTPEAVATDIAALKAFLAKYPQSSRKADAQALLDAYTDEQGRLQAGDVKLYGHWISKKDVADRQPQIQAQALYLEMQSSLAQGDMIGALNAFDQLEKKYPGSRVFPTAVGQAASLVAALQGEAATASANLKVTDAQWMQGVAITPEPQKSEMVAGHQADLARYHSMIAAQKARMKWPPFIPASQESLDAISGMVVPEQNRLIALPVDKMNASIAASDKAEELIASRDLSGADSMLKNATALWSANADVAFLVKKLADAKLAPQHPASTPAGVRTPAPKVAGASPAGTPKPVATPAATPEPATQQKIVDFLFTIPGAVTVVVCAIALFLLTSFLQKKKEKIGEEPEEQ